MFNLPSYQNNQQYVTLTKVCSTIKTLLNSNVIKIYDYFPGYFGKCNLTTFGMALYVIKEHKNNKVHIKNHFAFSMCLLFFK